jgi:BetI-type transcriptional repressor, C-terminal
VFDRLLLLLFEQFSDGQNPAERHGVPNVWECVRRMLDSVLNARPKFGPEFHALQYTFLAQIAHRADFRERLASLYAEWRQGMAAHWQVTAKPAAAWANNVSGRTIASFVQALVHGLTVQLAADPGAFDRTEMLELCVGVLAPLFTTPPAGDPAKDQSS